MKLFRTVMMLVCGIMFVSVLVGCEKVLVAESPQMVSQIHRVEKDVLLEESFSENGLKSYPKGEITINDFKATGKLLSWSEIEELIARKQIGESPKNAVVEVIFHKDGRLYTPYEINTSGINEDILLGSNGEQWGVSLDVFREVTGLKEATEDYSRDFGVFWVFDPMVKFYETRQEKELLKTKHAPTLLRSIQDNTMLYKS